MKVTALVAVKKYTSDIKNGCFKPTNDEFYSVALPPHRTSGLLFLESSSQLLHLKLWFGISIATRVLLLVGKGLRFCRYVLIVKPFFMV